MTPSWEEQRAREAAAEAFAAGIGATPAVVEMGDGYLTREEARILACLAEACDRFAAHAPLVFAMDTDRAKRNAAVEAFYAHIAAAQRHVLLGASRRVEWQAARGIGVPPAPDAADPAPSPGHVENSGSSPDV